MARHGQPLAALSVDEQASVKAAMQAMLQGVDLSARTAAIPDPLAAAIATRRTQIAQALLHHDFTNGWTQAYSLEPDQRRADGRLPALLLPDYGRAPARHERVLDAELALRAARSATRRRPRTFLWTWISFCFTFFAFGAVIFVYERFLNERRTTRRWIRC